VLKPEDASKLVASIGEAVRLLRHSPAETVAAALALLLVGCAASLGHVTMPAVLHHWITAELWQDMASAGSLVAYLLAGSLVGWIAWRLLKRLTPPPRSDAVRPNAIKGPMAFGPHDGPLFRNLGRTMETARLVDHVLNDQVGLVVVMGESGAGKTSLLRAGLADALQGRTPSVEFHYWEARPDDPEASILATMRAGWYSDLPAPVALRDLIAPPPANGRRVIVLDQFEQLAPAQHRAVFDLLTFAATTAQPPFRSTILIAFRQDYSPVPLSGCNSSTRN
jgi:hypothetical protein